MPFWIRESTGVAGPNFVDVRNFDDSNGVDASALNGRYTALTGGDLTTAESQISSSAGRYDPDGATSNIVTGSTVYGNATYLLWNRADASPTQGGWHITARTNTGVWAFQQSVAPQQSAVNRTAIWGKTDQVAGGTTETVNATRITFNGESGTQIVEQAPGTFLPQAEVFHENSSDGNMTPSMFPTLTSLAYHDFTVDVQSELSCVLNVDETAAATDNPQVNFAGIEGLTIRRSSGAAPAFGPGTSGTGGVTIREVVSANGQPTGVYQFPVGDPNDAGRITLGPSAADYDFDITLTQQINDFVGVWFVHWANTAGSNISNVVFHQPTISNGNPLTPVGNPGLGLPFGQNTARFWRTDVGQNIAGGTVSLRITGRVPAAGGSIRLGTGQDTSGTTGLFPRNWNSTNNNPVTYDLFARNGRTDGLPVRITGGTANNALINAGQEIQVQMAGVARAATFTYSGTVDAAPFDGTASPTGGVTATVVTAGSTLGPQLAQSTLGGTEQSFTLQPGIRYRLQHTGDGGFRYATGGGAPSINVGQNGRVDLGPFTAATQLRWMSSGGQDAASSVAFLRAFQNTFDITYTNTNPYAIQFNNNALPELLRQRILQPNESFVDRGAVVNTFRIAGQPLIGTSWTAQNNSGVALTINGTSVPTDNSIVQLAGTDATLRIVINETASNTITASGNFFGFADQFQDVNGNNLATGLGEIGLMATSTVTQANRTGNGVGSVLVNGFRNAYLQSGVARIISILFPLSVSQGQTVPVNSMINAANGYDITIPVGAEPMIGEEFTGMYSAGRSGSTVHTVRFRYEGGNAFTNLTPLPGITEPQRVGVTFDRGTINVGFFSITNESGQDWDQFALTVDGVTQTIQNFLVGTTRDFEFATSAQGWAFVASAAGAGENSHSISIVGAQLGGLEPNMTHDTPMSANNSVNLPGTCTQVVTARIYNNAGATGERQIASTSAVQEGSVFTLTIAGDDGGTVREVAAVYEQIGGTIREVRRIYLPDPIPTGAPREVFGPRLSPMPENTVIIPPNAARFNTQGPGSDLIEPTAGDARCARDPSIPKRWESTGGGCCDKKIYGARTVVAPGNRALFQIQALSFGRARFDIIGRSGCGNCCDCCQRQDVSTCFFLPDASFQVPLNDIFDGDFIQNVPNPNRPASIFTFNTAFDVADPTAIAAQDWRTWGRLNCFIGPVGGDQISMEVQWNFNNPTQWRMTRAGNCKSCGSAQGSPWGPVTLFAV